MKLCRDDLHAYGTAAASLAIHSAISFNDAVMIRPGGGPWRSENHQRAVAEITKACGRANVRDDGVKHLKTLLSAKTEVSYGDQRLDESRILALCMTAERFQAWAEKNLGRIAR